MYFVDGKDLARIEATFADGHHKGYKVNIEHVLNFEYNQSKKASDMQGSNSIWHSLVILIGASNS